MWLLDTKIFRIYYPFNFIYSFKEHLIWLAQALACIREWGLEDNDPRINPNGGAIAIGHPLGVSGTRIIHTAAIELHKQNKKYALITMCIGVGQGYATIIEKP